MTRIPWKESNLALIGSDLDNKIKAAAAQGEEQWQDVGDAAGLKVWRIEQFRVVPWPEENHSKFHQGDSYVVLNSYQVENKLLHDVHIWIGKESSQDEYGTAAYKMVELDEKLGGAAVQHREVQGHESELFQSYFDNLMYLEGGVESGFNHVEATKDTPHLYKVKGTQRGMSFTQVPLQKSSLCAGDSFILFGGDELVYVWHGESANPDEKARANSIAESMCKEGTVVALDQGQGDDTEEGFWALVGTDGDIAEADEGDETVEEFSPLLFILPEDPEEEPEQVAKGEPVKIRFSRPAKKLPRSALQDDGVYILDAGWEIFLWMGKSASRSAKINAMARAESYCKEDPRTADLPLSICKSGYESNDFTGYFFE